MTLTGRIAFRELEGGVWVLEADGGMSYELAGGDRKLKKAGAQVEVEGEVDDRSLSAAMVGPLFRVRSYRFL